MKFIYTFLFLSFSCLSIGQDGYHRLYETDLNDTLVINQDGVAVNETYVMMNYGYSKDRIAERLFITKLDKKGNIEGSYRISPPEDLEIEEFSGGNIIYNEITNRLVFSFVGKTAEENRIYLGYMTLTGEELLVTQLDSEAFDLSQLSVLYADESVTENTILIDNDASSFNVVKVADDQSFQWASGFVSDNNDLLGYSSDINSQGETVVAGFYNSTGERGLFYVKVDAQGDILSSKKYPDMPGDFIENYSDVKVLTKEDGGLYISAQNETYNGVLLSLDTIGDILWAKEVRFSNLDNQVSSLTANNNGGVIISGTYEDNSQLRHFTVNIGSDGYPVNASQYQNNNILSDYRGTSVDYDAASGGYFMVGNSTNEMDTVITLMAHTDLDSIPCSDLMEIDTFQNHGIGVDTLIVTKDISLTTLNNIAFESERLTLFSVPELSIDADQRRFCPDEEVNELLTASVSIAPANTVSYLWGDDVTTTDTIRGTETDVPYVVEATVNFQECFIMCDTIQLTRYPTPMVNILPAALSNCEWVLNGNVENLGALKNGNVSFNWSTGETSQNITVSEGTYNLTVTDDCGEEANASITLQNSVVGVDIIILENNNCENATLGLDITNPGSNMSVQWGTGETTPTINVTQPGGYSVTVVDQDCNISATDDFNYEQNEPVTGYQINTSDITCDPLNGTLSVSTTGGVSSIDFISPSGIIFTNNEIDINQRGVVQILISDLCGNSFQDSVNINSICPIPCIDYPNVFFPDGDANVESELTFGPVILDGCEGTVIQEIGYEFRIFNRWGQEVFSTTDPAEQWDGTFDDEDAPSEVYVYYALYKIEGDDEEKLAKGDVTIIR